MSSKHKRFSLSNQQPATRLSTLMKNNIDQIYKQAKIDKRLVFTAFVTAGDPDLSSTRTLVQELYKAGVDIVELGIPHSDPVAEGPVIQAASTRALKHNTSIDDILKLSASIDQSKDDNRRTALALMGYANTMRAYGWKQFLKRSAEAGITGLIAADTPYDAIPDLHEQCANNNIHLVRLIAPTTSIERLVNIAYDSTGFIYCVSSAGVTGVRKNLDTKHIRRMISSIRRVSDTPVAVGFGISQPEQVTALRDIADGVIVGSALIKELTQGKTTKQGIQNVARLATKLYNACS